MNVSKISEKITVRPTDRKIRQAKRTVESSGILPKEMPLERNIYIKSYADIIQDVKNKIQLSIENMKGQL